MADNESRTEALALDALVGLIDKGVRVSERGKTAAEAPRSPMAAAANDMAACAIKNTDAEVELFGASKIDPKIIALKDQQHLQSCIDDFAHNVRLADSGATNNLPKGDNGGRKR